MPPGRSTDPPGPPPGFELRPARPEDLPICGRIWRTALNDYFVRLNLPPIPADSESVARLHAHALTTDPGGFVVAVRAGGARRSSGPPGQPVAGSEIAETAGFAAALRRGSTWFLSMLFVDPGAQGAGLGRALLERVLPPRDERSTLNLALVSDSAQPISNGLYASLGIVPRLPVWNLVGRPAPGSMPGLPQGMSAAGDDPGGQVDEEIRGIDRAVLGFEHPRDHAFARDGGRLRFLYRAADGGLAGYGYASPIGHVGPVAVREPALLAPVLGHLLEAVRPPGASSIWLSGAAGHATSILVRAGLRLDGFPVLLCWSRPFADFDRYVPHSPGLL